MTTLLFIVAVLVAIAGIVRMVQGDLLVGVILLAVAALVGPGGYSLFS